MTMEKQITETLQHYLERDGINFSLAEISAALEFLSNVSEALIIINIPSIVFDDPEVKAKFESFFMEVDPGCRLSYLRSFRRVRVDMSGGTEAAIVTKVRFNEVVAGGRGFVSACVLGEDEVGFLERMRCFFAQDVTVEASDYLQVPQVDRLFLISPPASPPVGWEPREEGEPVLNYELLAALASLGPGESHQLHPGSEEHPAIVITPCADPPDNEGDNVGACHWATAGPPVSRIKIEQTRCPDRRA